jgi:hypothetical protein
MFTLVRTVSTRTARPVARQATSGIALLVRRTYVDRTEGSIRSAGGTFSQKEKAIEDQYFRMRDAEKLKILKEKADMLRAEIEKTEKMVQEHQEKLDQERQEKVDNN